MSKGQLPVLAVKTKKHKKCFVLVLAAKKLSRRMFVQVDAMRVLLINQH